MPDGKPDLTGFYQADAGGSNYGLERKARTVLSLRAGASLSILPMESCRISHGRVRSASIAYSRTVVMTIPPRTALWLAFRAQSIRLLHFRFFNRPAT